MKKPQDPTIGPKKFKVIPPNNRLNSEMIRRVLFDTLESEFGYQLTAMSDALEVAVKSSSDQRSYDVRIPESSFKTVISDTHSIKYTHLNALAKHYKIPISALLLFTRIRDEMETVEKRKTDQAKHIIAAVRAALDHLDTVVDHNKHTKENIYSFLGHNAFKQFVDVYLDTMAKQIEQPTFDFGAVTGNIERRQNKRTI